MTRTNLRQPPFTDDEHERAERIRSHVAQLQNQLEMINRDIVEFTREADLIVPIEYARK